MAAKAWINTASLAYRYELARELVNESFQNRLVCQRRRRNERRRHNTRLHRRESKLAVSGQMHPWLIPPSPILP